MLLTTICAAQYNKQKRLFILTRVNLDKKILKECGINMTQLPVATLTKKKKPLLAPIKWICGNILLPFLPIHSFGQWVAKIRNLTTWIMLLHPTCGKENKESCLRGKND